MYTCLAKNSLGETSGEITLYGESHYTTARHAVAEPHRMGGASRTFIVKLAVQFVEIED